MHNGSNLLVLSFLIENKIRNRIHILFYDKRIKKSIPLMARAHRRRYRYNHLWFHHRRFPLYTEYHSHWENGTNNSYLHRALTTSWSYWLERVHPLPPYPEIQIQSEVPCSKHNARSWVEWQSIQKVERAWLQFPLLWYEPFF